MKVAKLLLTITISLLLTVAPLSAIEQCTVDGGCPNQNVCGATSYEGYFSLFGDFSEIEYWRSYCSISKETITESYTVACDSPSAPCQAKEFMDQLGEPYNLYYNHQ